MRLTLRTMLAYLDDVLEPGDAAELGKKLDESERAKQLMRRIQHVISRRRLDAPRLDGRALGGDPNTVAEYLDGTMQPDRVGEFEKVCLESDMQLAESASCHHILTMVLEKPANVAPVLRDKIYRIASTRSSQEAVPGGAETYAPDRVSLAEEYVDPPLLRRGRRAAETVASDQGMVEAPPVIDPAIAAPPAVVSKGVAPRGESEDASSSGSKMLIPILGLVAAILLLVTMIGVAMLPDQVRGIVALVTSGPSEAERQNGEEVFNDVAEDEAASHVDGGSDELAEATKALQTQGTIGDTFGGAVPDGQVQQLLLDAPATDGVLDPADAPDPDLEGDRVTAEGMTANAEEDSAASGGVETGAIPPGPVAVGTLDSEVDLLGRFDTASDQWYRVPSRASLFAGDALLSFPASRPRLAIDATFHATMVESTLCRFDRDDESGTVSLKIDFGRMVIATAGKPGVQLNLTLGSRTGTLTFVDENSVAAVELTYYLPPGADPIKDAPLEMANIIAAQGTIEWSSADGSINLPGGQAWTATASDPSMIVALTELPQWVFSPVSGIDRTAIETIETMIVMDQPLGQRLLGLIDDDRVEVRTLAARCLTQLGIQDGFLKSLAEPRDKSYWRKELDEIREFLSRGPDQGRGVKSAVEAKFGESSGAEVYSLILGFGSEQLESGAAAELVQYLSHPALEVRILAIENLRRITGQTALYRAESSERERLRKVRSWEDRLEDGKVVYRVPPAPPSLSTGNSGP